MNVIDSLIARSIGPRPSHPLPALTTVLFPERFVTRLYASTTDQCIDWGAHRAAVTLSFDIDLPEDVEALPWLLDVQRAHRRCVMFARWRGLDASRALPG